MRFTFILFRVFQYVEEESFQNSKEITSGWPKGIN